MIYFISHRGNLNGPNKRFENKPEYIDVALSSGFEAEIDIWVKNETLYLGHDLPQYKITFDWLLDRISKIWIHCKNIEAIVYFNSIAYDFNYFWHENDTITLTSKGNIWAFPGRQPIKNSIAVMPEINNDSTLYCSGICSDYIKKIKDGAI